jgi:uncharacterized membrane protein
MRYIKRGIATLIPLLLVVQVFSFLFSFIRDLYQRYLAQYEPVSSVILISSVLLAIFLLGFATTHFKTWQKIKNYVEKNWIGRLPLVGTIYSFGSDVVNTFTNDVKDNDMIVIEIDFGGFKALGVLTDKKNDLGFIISAPSPLTGVVLKLPNYRIVDIKFSDAAKINSSLGRIGGEKWI